MSYTENALVIHRVGGLEVAPSVPSGADVVIHRVGGLEEQGSRIEYRRHVIHRVGGLEAVRPG